jgi:hypothetical protein
MFVFFIERINRKISQLYICYQMNVVSIDQITFIDQITLLQKQLIKTLKQ